MSFLTKEQWMDCGCCSPMSFPPGLQTQQIGRTVTAAGFSAATSNASLGGGFDGFDPSEYITRYKNYTDRENASGPWSDGWNGDLTREMERAKSVERATNLFPQVDHLNYVFSKSWSGTATDNGTAAHMGPEGSPYSEWEHDVEYSLSHSTGGSESATKIDDGPLTHTGSWTTNRERLNYWSSSAYGLIWDGTTRVEVTTGTLSNANVTDGALISATTSGGTWTRTYERGEDVAEFTEKITPDMMLDEFLEYCDNEIDAAANADIGLEISISKWQRNPIYYNGEDLEDVHISYDGLWGRWRLRVPAGHTGSYYAAKWQMVEVDLETGEEVDGDEELLEWSGPGNESDPDDDSWFTGWVDAPEPVAGKEYRIKVVQWKHTHSGRWMKA